MTLLPFEIENSESVFTDSCDSTSKNLIDSILSSNISTLNGLLYIGVNISIIPPLTEYSLIYSTLVFF